MQKRIYISTVLLLVFGLLVGAATAKRHRGKKLEKMQQRLNLTQDQVEQLRPLFEQAQERRKAAREAFRATLTPEQQAQLEGLKGKERRRAMKSLQLTPEQQQQRQAMKEQRKANRQAMKEQIQSVLTPEQQQLWQQHRAERKGKKRQR